jgi:hypothetical protein
LEDSNKTQEIEEGDKDRQIDSENNENWSKKEGMTEIAEDTETGPEDETEDELEGLLEDTPAWAMSEVKSINVEMATKAFQFLFIFTETEKFKAYTE